MLRRKLTKTKAQATTELALFGVIIMVIFGALLRYGMTYTATQKTQMIAFRKALELAKKRHDGTPIPLIHEQPDNIFSFLGGFQVNIPFLNIPIPWGNREFAAVNVNVQRNVYPVDANNPLAPVETSMVSGSAAVNIETEARNFANNLNDGLGPLGMLYEQPMALEDTERSYYQVGDHMAKENKYYEPKYILVKRKSNDKAPSHPWDGFFNLLDGKNEKKDYVTLQAVPYRDIESVTNITAADQYREQVGTDQINYNQTGQVYKTSTTIFHPPSVFGTNSKPDVVLAMWLWDQKIDPIGTLLLPPWAAVEDMTVTTEQTITKQREWNTPRQ